MILYNVNEDKRAVSARFAGMELAVESSLMKALDDFDYTIVKTVSDKFAEQGRFHMIGFSLCHEDDEWDAEVGKKLAKQRLLRKYHVLLHEILLAIKKETNKQYTYTMNKLNSKINKYIENSKLHAGHIL